jgi:SAM-dependent methyltransferase
MNTFIQDTVKNFKKQKGKFNKVLEIGSWNVNGGVRQFFKDADEYIGIDPMGGKGVDLKISSYEIPNHFKKENFDCILCLETLEHDPYFEYTVQLMHDYLKQGGWLVISSPGLAQGIHNAPGDYYRFMPDVYQNIFFKGYEHLSMGVAFRPGHTPRGRGKDKNWDWTNIVTAIAYAQKPKKDNS